MSGSYLPKSRMPGRVGSRAGSTAGPAQTAARLCVHESLSCLSSHASQEDVLREAEAVPDASDADFRLRCARSAECDGGPCACCSFVRGDR